MNSHVFVRRMEPCDVEECASFISQIELFQQYGWKKEKAKQQLLLALEEPEAILASASLDDQILGFCWLIKKGAFGRSPYLRLIAVSPEAHRKGVGRALMHWLERNYLSPNGLFLLTTHTNIEAQSFYESLGYKQIGEIPSYLREDLHEKIYYKCVGF